MVAVTPNQLAQVWHKPENVRNICIIAHVDHGKTTLSDFLVSSNGIISNNLAGTIRYMDSRPDEQDKGITMKSSSITLFHQSPSHVNPHTGEQEQYLVNLIDSPGHVDFSSEVSTAARLTDGAVVLIDVVEGVRTQTRAVLHQAFRENIKPCLVLNKMDRLILEKQMTPMEAYEQLDRILVQINVLMATFHTAKIFRDEEERYTLEQEKSKQKQGHAITTDNSTTVTQTEQSDDQPVVSSTVLDREIDSNDFFSPSKGNVVFASAYHGWGFRINDFAEIFQKKMGMNKSVLQEALWGSHYLDVKTKKIRKKPARPNQDNMFVQFILSNIYNAYDCVLTNRNEEKMQKIISTLNLTLPNNFMKRQDHKSQLKTLMNKWLPLSDTVLVMVIDKLPSPKLSQERLHKLLPELEFSKKPKTDQKTSKPPTSSTRRNVKIVRKKVKKNLLSCDPSTDSEVLVFVSKMLEVDSLPDMQRALDIKNSIVGSSFSSVRFGTEMTREESIKQNQQQLDDFSSNNPNTLSEEPEVQQDTQVQDLDDIENHLRDHFVGFARIFCGTIKVGQTLQVLGPRYHPNAPDTDRHEFTVTRLYMMMGRELFPVDQVPAGNVFAIGDIGSFVLKSATISSSLYSPLFSSMHFAAAPIVRFAIEPENLLEMPKLVKGLKLLNQADPSVEVFVQETGEHVIMTAGEVHAERCERDLRERFARVELNMSPPIVSFKETIVNANKQDVIVQVKTANKQCTIKINARSLPDSISRFIDDNADRLKFITSSEDSVKDDDVKIDSQNVMSELREVFESSGWGEEWDHLWSLGPRRMGPNVLLNHIKEYPSPFFKNIEGRANVNVIKSPPSTSADNSQQSTNSFDFLSHFQQFDTNFISGFQLATNSGPLCNEPMSGVCFSIVEVTMTEELINTLQKKKNSSNDPSSQVPDEQFSYGTFGGQIMSAMKEGCRKAFEKSERRLVEATYKCEIQATNETVGNVYSVLRRRRAEVLAEEVEEGTGLFLISANLPVAESFGLSHELRDKSSGAATAQLAFSHWQVLEVDPFYEPKTEDEIEEWGEQGNLAAPNIAKNYINDVRRRKGLLVEKKIVESSEKQRNMSRKK
ncbi:ribosome assembly protein 1 [Acrasis kona]|uniref:Elongation factor-like 1 n=1 Tax=Acrasis kona TaxID=1008807 RepID=A0AAW2YY83_9EUKA